MKHLRIVLVGFGVVGRGFVELLAAKRDYLRQRYDFAATLLGVASARHGFVYADSGFDSAALLELEASGRPLSEYPGSQHWGDALEGLRETRADVLVEVTPTNLRDAEPAMSHLRAAISRGMHVITANKGPAALAARDLQELAREYGVQLRMESTVMAGTPVISTIREGLAGAAILGIRGILNGTTNYILTAMATGRDYAEVLAEAQALGYAETDPTADVEGYDVVAKTLILAALAFDEQLAVDQVRREGITGVTREQIIAAGEQGKRIKLIATLSRNAEGRLDASVAPVALPVSDPLARVDGATNAITIETDTLPAVTIIGPGAGPVQTAQGLLSDLLAISAQF